MSDLLYILENFKAKERKGHTSMVHVGLADVKEEKKIFESWPRLHEFVFGPF